MSRKQNKKIANYIRVLCLSGALVAYSASAYAVVANNTLPSGEHNMHGISKIERLDNIMNIMQGNQNAVIKWGDFSIGANATVNFSKDGGGKFNILNYVDSGKVSEIYGAMNAKDGNVFIANTAGVVIGKSAQINVGSLYVTNKKLDENKFSQFNGSINNMFTQNQPPTAAELMSLGNINASRVTFDGDRVVLDTDRLSYNDGKAMAAKDIIVKTTDKDNVVIGYSAYDAENKTYAGKNNGAVIATVNDKEFTKADGYMWVKNVEQLQAINTNLGGNYALNDSIDAIVTKDWNDGKGFVFIGNDKNAFTGKFDGLDYSIFGLTINRADENNVGLFGVANGATINNATLVSGNITGGTNVGAVVGKAANTHLNNIVNSAHVVGNKNVGGVIGSGDKVVINGAINTAPVKGHENVGGLAGELTNESKLIGLSYNLGAVTGISSVNEDGSIVEDGVYEHIKESASGANGLSGEEFAEKYSHNIGGLVGSASNSTLGDGNNQIFNQLDVTGGYNIGGIVGNIEDEKGNTIASSINNAANNGDITAVGYVNEEYLYQSGEQVGNNIITNKNDHGITFDSANTENQKASNVHVSNVGGIAGNINADDDKKVNVNNVINTGDVKSIKVKDDKFNNLNADKNGSDGTVFEYYIGGNVGGIVGRGENTSISDATNKQNNVFGAYNVGGIAGSLTDSSVKTALNDGSNVTATGARGNNGFVMEDVHKYYQGYGSQEVFIIGNTGGIVGFMKDSTVDSSANSGNIYNNEFYYEKGFQYQGGGLEHNLGAANTGGIVGRIENTTVPDENGQNKTAFTVKSSYNTGNVSGYTGIGGIVGTMYNGSVGYSYNLGNIKSIRKSTGNSPLNMGGIVGDTTEKTASKAYLYNVYNKGQIGDENYNTYGRHVGGIVGRLSGTVDASYNNGAIYNAYSENGGIVGWWYRGNINNSFNTGNITVKNINIGAAGYETGGIAGGVSGNAQAIYDSDKVEGKPLFEQHQAVVLQNSYNLGKITANGTKNNEKISIGGIVGGHSYGGNSQLVIKNVYANDEISYTDRSGNKKI